MLALHEAGLLAAVTPGGAARVLAEMDDNGDGVVSFEEFRGAYSRLVKLRGEEARQARFRAAAAAPTVPSAAAVDPRLAAAFREFAAYGTAKGLAERTPRGGSEGMTGRQFQRACAAAGLTVGTAVIDVVFAGLCAGKTRTLPFIRFLEALAKVGAAWWWVGRRFHRGGGRRWSQQPATAAGRSRMLTAPSLSLLPLHLAAGGARGWCAA